MGEPERGSRRKHLQKIVKNVTFDCYEQAVHYNSSTNVVRYAIKTVVLMLLLFFFLKSGCS